MVDEKQTTAPTPGKSDAKKTSNKARRVPRVKVSITLSPAIFAELSVFADKEDCPLATVLEHAAARFLLIRGVRIPGLWDDPDLAAVLAPGLATAAPQR